MAALTVMGLLALALLVVPFAGCSSNDEAAPAQMQDEPDVYCPDTLLEGDSVVFSTSVDSAGEPQGIATTFPTDTAEIFCTFTLTGDLCCSNVVVMWQHGGETVFYWSQDGTGMPETNTVSMARPEGGFAGGEYQVKVFIFIREVISETFIVE
jgi:hypothetical protein